MTTEIAKLVEYEKPICSCEGQRSLVLGSVGTSKLKQLDDTHFCGDEYGSQVALTSDVSCLAVSARRNDADGKKKDTGHVRVFRYDSSDNT